MPETGPKNESAPKDLQEAVDLNINGDKNHEIQIYTEWAADKLKITLGVDNLSTIEGVYLRNAVERLMPKIKEEKILAREGKMSSLNITEFEDEAAALWLYDMYGIHIKDIPRIYLIDDETENQTYKFERTSRGEAKKKYQELESKGHDVYFRSTIPDDFKEYVHRLRENAHGAEPKEEK